MEHEIEVKVRIEGPAAFGAKVRAAGGELAQERTFEDNRLYDRGGLLAGEGRLLRLRSTGSRAVLTAKAKVDGGPAGFKVRREAEIEVADAGAAAAVLETAGLSVSWRYQKWRTIWRLEGCAVTLDEIPHGAFAEIEGDPAAIERAAAKLGFARSDWVTETYREIHERWCREHGLPVLDMVFEDGR
jgi:adenylate cyclase class 2